MLHTAWARFGLVGLLALPVYLLVPAPVQELLYPLGGLACVGAVGSDDHLPAAAVEAALALLSGEPLVAYAFDVEHGDPIGHVLRAGAELARERYVHRRTATGGERIWEAVVLRMPARAGARASAPRSR